MSRRFFYISCKYLKNKWDAVEFEGVDGTIDPAMESASERRVGHLLPSAHETDMIARTWLNNKMDRKLGRCRRRCRLYMAQRH